MNTFIKFLLIGFLFSIPITGFGQDIKMVLPNSTVEICVNQGTPFVLTPQFESCTTVDGQETCDAIDISGQDFEYELRVYTEGNSECTNFTPVVFSNSYTFDFSTMPCGDRDDAFIFYVRRLVDGELYEGVDNTFSLTIFNNEPLTTSEANQVFCTSENPTINDIVHSEFCDGTASFFLDAEATQAADVTIPSGATTYYIFPRGYETCNTPPLVVNTTVADSNGAFVGTVSDVSLCDATDTATITPNVNWAASGVEYTMYVFGACGDAPPANNITFTDSYTGSFRGLFPQNYVSDATVAISTVDPGCGTTPDTFIVTTFQLNLLNEFQARPQQLARSYFSSGVDINKNGNTEEDELTYSALYYLFLQQQSGVLDDQESYSGDTYSSYSINLFKTPTGGSAINPDSSDFHSYINDPTANPPTDITTTNGGVTVYFEMEYTGAGGCGGYSDNRIPFTLCTYDLDPAIVNPQQYFCAANNPTASDINRLEAFTGNPLGIWDAPVGGNRVTGLLEDEKVYYVSEFGFPTKGCEPYDKEIFSFQRIPVEVHLYRYCDLTPETCACNSFYPLPNERYIISGWVKEETTQQQMTYSNTSIGIAFLGTDSYFSFTPKGRIIDGWQKIVGEFIVPADALKINIVLNSGNSIAYFDDIRIHPFNGNMKSFVYDPENQRLMAEQDENNYSTFYEYDKEGGLIRVKKETEKGVYTIQETRSKSKTAN